MSEPGAVRQSDFFPKAGIQPKEARQIRERLLLDEDWYKEGATIWIRPSGIQKLVIAEEEPRLAPQYFKVQVKRQAINPRWVECHPTKGLGDKIFAEIPQRLRGRLVGKVIKVERSVKENGEPAYRWRKMAEGDYASLPTLGQAPAGDEGDGHFDDSAGDER